MNKVNDPVVTQSVLKKELDEAFAKNNKLIIDEIGGILDIFANQIDERFNKIEERMDAFDQKLEQLTRTIDGFIKRIDNYETEQVARDAEVQRLTRWIQQIAKETGVKLKGSLK